MTDRKESISGEDSLIALYDMDDMFAALNGTVATVGTTGAYRVQGMGVTTGGHTMMRAQSKPLELVRIQLPSVTAGCNWSAGRMRISISSYWTRSVRIPSRRIFYRAKPCAYICRN